MFLSSEQRSYIRTNCAQWLSNPVPFLKERAKNNVRVFSVNKVRWSSVNHVKYNSIVEQLIGVRHASSRSILVNSDIGVDSVYVIPFDGWRWIPVAPSLDIENLTEHLLHDVVVQQITHETDLVKLAEQKTPMCIVGAMKYIAIRKPAYSTMSQLVEDLVG